MPVGAPLFDFTVSHFSAQMKRFLVLLSVPSATSFTVKGFRAGHATELAKRNVALGAIMQMGEWRSAACLRYIAEDEVDTEVMCKEILDSDAE